jgi:hypothetical protein
MVRKLTTNLYGLDGSTTIVLLKVSGQPLLGIQLSLLIISLFLTIMPDTRRMRSRIVSLHGKGGLRVRLLERMTS